MPLNTARAWAMEPRALQTLLLGAAAPAAVSAWALEGAHLRVAEGAAEPFAVRVEAETDFGSVLPWAAALNEGAGGAPAVAVIPVMGVLDQRSSLFTELFGGTSYTALARTFQEAMRARNVLGVVFDIDSPGGSVSGLEELATLIRKARGSKPIVAVADPWAASAAYYLAAQADKVLVTPSGQVGSIGTILVHGDLSGALEQAGIHVTLITSSPFKGEGNPYEALGEEARAEFQRVVDDYGARFERDVAAGRGVPLAQVRADFGRGRMSLPAEAVRRGLADRIGTLDDAVRAVARGATGNSRAAGAAGAVIDTEALAAAVTRRLTKEATDD